MERRYSDTEIGDFLLDLGEFLKALECKDPGKRKPLDDAFREWSWACEAFGEDLSGKDPLSEEVREIAVKMGIPFRSARSIFDIGRMMGDESCSDS